MRLQALSSLALSVTGVLAQQTRPPKHSSRVVVSKNTQRRSGARGCSVTGKGTAWLSCKFIRNPLTFCTAEETINKMKDNLQNGRKYLEMMQLTRMQFPKYTNDSYSSISKNSIKKIGRRSKETFLQRRHMGGQQTYENMLHIANY